MYRDSPDLFHELPHCWSEPGLYPCTYDRYGRAVGWFEHDEILDEVPPPGMGDGPSGECEDCRELEWDGEYERCPFCSHFTACPECGD